VRIATQPQLVEGFMNRSTSVLTQQADRNWETKAEAASGEAMTLERNRFARLLERKQEACHELSEAGRHKDEFLATLGHELRNPLSDIISAIQILEQLSFPDAAAREMHDVIKRQSLHMSKLIDDLLDLSRVTCGKIALEMERLDLVSLVNNAIANHKLYVQRSRLTLTPKLPAWPIWVVADATRLTQVVTNVLHNATKFTDPGGRIWVNVDCDAAFAVIEVRDTGIGMEPDEVERIFEPFHQVESAHARNEGGLGLGLALSKQLVEKQGGLITATSEGAGRGCVFCIQLPLSQQPDVCVTSEPIAPLAVAPAPHRILIVDDRRDARLTLSVLLERLGQHVMQAENGADAVSAAVRFQPHLVLCDIGLPDMDGYAVARAMRSDSRLRGVRLVALTGYGQPEDRDRALQAGFDCHLTKPISNDQLKDLLCQMPA